MREERGRRATEGFGGVGTSVHSDLSKAHGLDVVRVTCRKNHAFGRRREHAVRVLICDRGVEVVERDERAIQGDRCTR